ncbi:MAG TPA: Ig-like domain-containing protein [Candidatus Eisenbacteria bacterium]|nr:Ig-like domain-containing protein [Candidatus Eisenbacteria bacterium]
MRSPLFSARIRNIAAACAVAFLYAPAAAFAQGTGGPDLGLGYATAIGLTTTDIRTTVSRIISYFLGFLGIVAVCIMLYAGFLWMTAGGSEEKVSTAKRWMINGTIGLVIIMSAFAITQFIFRAVEEGAGGGGGGCPPGLTCTPGGIGGGGGGGGFRVDGTTPAGAGPGNGGWPKNYAITVSFNSAVADGSVTPSTFTVRKCNARLNGSGDPQTFSNGGCGAPIAGTLTVDNNRVRFKPNASSEADPTDFDHDFWYKVSVTNAIRDMASRTLLCPFETLDISLVGGNDDYCDRAVAFNDIRDVTPPTVAIGAPVSPPAYCASALIHTAQISATGNDDFLVAGIDFLLDGGATNLVDSIGDPRSNDTNGAMANPFTSSSVYVDILPLAPGQHHVTAVAQDGVPQSSTTADSQFEVVPTHCCNSALDAADGETDIDCGGACHSCNGASCTTGADCASGFCNPATHQCEERPFIQSVSPGSGGVGTLITLTGTGFGSAAGSVTFLGAAGDGDDVIAVACAPEAWTDTQVTVAVPAGSIGGPLKLTTAGGPSDTTDDGFGPHLSDFSVGGPTAPGICYLAPSTGAPGSKFAVNGAGFGATIGTSTAFMGATSATVTTCGAGETDCGWSDTRVWLTAPPIAENVYPVHLIINGASTNNSNFLLRNSASSTAPHVTGVIPESGPVGSYVTVQGSGFGSLKGTVSLKFGAADVAITEDPACDDNWHDNYIIIKVPPQYQDTTPVNVSAGGVSHKVQVVTAPPARTSNDDITFKITNEAPRPGICSMTPDNGPPGNAVVVEGEGFGAGPGSPTANPRFSVQFFKTNAKHCLFAPFSACTNVGATCSNPAEGICIVNAVSSPGYSSWTGNSIGSVIAGETVKHCSINTGVLCADAGLACPVPTDGTCVADRSGWPATGPVYVVANNRLSTNAIPFTVQDCNEAGGHCPVGQSCCANGSCQASCLPVARNSAYSWRFSTNVLPVLPRVVERAICSATTIPPVPQSPSPYKDSTDACKNAMLFFEFNRGLDKASFDTNSVKVEECGSGSTPTCTGVIPLNPFSSPGTFGSCDSLEPDLCKTFETRPANAYNGGTHYFKQNTWYRVTLISNPGGSVGLKEPGAAGRYLDGDDDGSQGGNYVYDFRVRDSADPCQVSSVYVDAPVATIQQDQDPVNFNAGLWGGNCNRLQCGPTEPYAITWSKLGPYLTLMAPLNAACTQPTKGVQETSPGSPTPLTASVTPLDAAPPGGVPTGPVKDGHSDVTVKFADPRVVEVTPKAECVQACINAAIVATFNVPMDAATLNGSTVELKRCRNASCTAPFEANLGGATTASIQAIPEDGVSGAPPTVLHKHVSIVLTGDMLPGTFYLARIKGGATGVKSRSGVQLAGLNDGQSFVWKFRTKDDPTACSVARAELRPNRAVALYVGDRKTFTAIPYGSPDECSAGGQQLRATSYSWLWDFDAPTPNRVLRGFFSGSTTLPIYNNAAPGDLVDAKPIPKNGCSSNCLFTGSQSTVPQCGNGAVDPQFEECDDGNSVDNDACTNQCLLRGNVGPACGDHVVDATAGEICDMIPDPAAPGSFVWPNGCKQPGVHVEGFFDNIGCLFTGSSTAAGSVCGNNFQSDGEACDDGNTANGDGCSSNCLKEGTLRSCLDVGPTDPCINFCGNGRAEPGEDPACEPAPGAAGCDAQTCLKQGTAHCSGGPNCCGNGVDDAGEDPGCDTDPERAEFCTDRCLYKGSSAYYTSPSFCSDGIAGKGEKPLCEPSNYVGTDHPKTDPYQAVSAAPQTGFDPSTAAGSTTTVKATVTGVPNEDAGRANVTLACNCKNEPPGSQDSYCQSIDPPATNNLACADNGCCTPRPTVTAVMPTIFNSCRNPQITVTFSELMNTGSISQHLLVGYNNGGAPCPAGSTALSFGTASGTPGFWQRLWNGVVAFVRTFVLRPVFGSPPSAPSVAEQNETYCSVPGNITTISEGPPGSQHSKTYFNVVRALPANKYIRIQLDPGVKSGSGVPLTGNVGQAYRAYFGTGPTICTIDKVAVSPPSVLLASIDERQTVAALGLSASGQAIVPTLDYNWLWSWTLPAVPTPPTVPPAIVLEPRETNITSCTLGSVCTSGGGCSCTINGSSCTVANGAATCPVTSLEIQGFADVRVRGSDPNDVMNGSAPHNSSAPEMIEALANLVNPSGAAFTISCTLGATCTAGGGCPCTVSATGCTVPNGQISCNAPTAAISSIVTSDTGRATVLLCKKPWPKYQTCTAGILDLPWVPGTNNGSCTADTWFPFYDELTNIEFYYCRDGAAPAGDVGTALPCLKEGPALVLNPGADILREYLFTFETNPAKCPSGPDAATGKWISDAVGLRFSTNTSHMSVNDWYFAKGFRGAPVKTRVNGYEALQEGRTAYVNTAAKLIPSGKLYTNVDVMSYSEGAQPETVSIFNQLLGYVNFNRNADLSNMGMCRKGELRASAAVKCNTSLDCQLNAAGIPVPGREGYICDAASGDCQRRQCAGGPNAGKDCTSDTFCAPSTCGSPSPTPWAGRSIACDSDVDCQVDSKGDPIPGRGLYKCDVPKSKLIRDVRRWSDLQTLRSQLIAKKNVNGTFPTLDAGTFLRAQTNSRWPSWNAALGTPLGLSLPVDPLNRHAVCGSPGYDHATCWNDKDRLYTCPVDSHVYEYRSVGGGDFQIRNDFEYINVNGGTDVWSGSTCLEHNTNLADCVADPSGQCGGTCDDASVNRGSTCLIPADCSGGSCLATSGKCNYREGKLFIGHGSSPFIGQMCAGATVGVGGVCGDGILSATETCEIGQVRAQSCDADMTGGTRAGSYPQVCNNVCQWVNQGKCSANSTNHGTNCLVDSQCTGTGAKCVTFVPFQCVGGTNPGTACAAPATCLGGGVCTSACVGGQCGDGVRQNPPEACDDGPLNGTYGHCNSNCNGSANSCGDGKKQPNEACDCKEKNGQYYFNGILSTGSEPGVSGTACGLAGGNQHSCAWDCQSAGPRCGDNVTNGTEICDGGFEEFKGYCNDTAQTGCNTSGECPELGTCVATHCSNDAAKSCATNDDCVKVCGSFCPTPEQKRRRECTPNDADNVPSNDDATACTWGTWSCTSPGSCGNGAKETGEQCDDGNTNNNDACIIDVSKNYMCRSAQCGDGYINPGTGEECDDGIENGRACVPEYGLTCTYCSGACRTNTVSGGFCGDGLIQDSTWTPPPGPAQVEECDGSTGLGPDWICVGKAQQYKSFGTYFGQALCSGTNCHRSCTSPDAGSCLNTVGTNSDSNDTCGAGTGPGCHVPGAGKKLYDICDPDDDNDGVPGDGLDCNDTNKAVHGAYHIEWDDDTGHHAYNIPAATEICNDVDEDCNGVKETHLVVTGTVLDVQTGGALAGAKIEFYCGLVKITETSTFTPSGGYSMDYWFDNTICTGATQWKTVLVHPDPLCPATNEKVHGYSVNSCLLASNEDFEVTKKPPDGTVRGTVSWDANRDLDFHMYTTSSDSASNHLHLYYGSGGAGTGYRASVNDGGNLYTLDVDDTGSSSGLKNPGGIETITVPRKAGVWYHFAIHDYTSSGTNWSTYGPSTGPRLRIYYDNCATYNPEFGAWPGFLNSGLRWLAFISAADVALPAIDPPGAGCDNRYVYCCYPNTSPGPCAAVCTNSVDGSNNPTCVEPKSE